MMIDINRIAETHGRKLSKIVEINNTETDKFVYVLKRFYKFLIYMVVLVTIATLLKVVISTSIVFITIFMLRMQFGGMHVNNVWLCLFISLLIPLSLGMIAKYIEFRVETLIIVYIFAYIIAIFIGTVDSDKRKLNHERKIRHKRRGLIILTIFMIMSFIMCLQNNHIIVSGILLGIITTFGNVVIVK